jgi:hypothetical protein
MHVLIGALVGAGFAVLLTVGMSLLAGRRPSWKHVALAALGGAVAGAVASATLGAGGLAGTTLARQAVGFGLGGAAGGAGEQVAENALDGRPLGEGVARSTLVGGGAGLVSLGVTRAGGAVVSRVLPPAPASASPALGTSRSLLRTVMTAPTPGSGAGVRRGLEAREEALAAEEPELPAQELPAPPGLHTTPGLTGALGAF